MKATIIDQTNRPYFEAAIPEELKRSDILIGAIEEGRAIGVLCCDLVGEEALLFHLRYLYVAEEYRGLGAGTGMMRLLQTLILHKGAAPIVYFECLIENGDDRLPRFFEPLGFFSDREDYPVFVFPVRTIERSFSEDGSDPGHSAPSQSSHAKPLSEVPEREWKQLRLRFQEADIDLPFLRQAFDPEVSFICFEDEKPAACILFKRLSDGWLLRLLGNTGDHAERNFKQMIQSSARALRKKADKSSLLYVCADRPGTEQLLEQYLSVKPLLLGVSRYYRVETGRR